MPEHFLNPVTAGAAPIGLHGPYAAFHHHDRRGNPPIARSQAFAYKFPAAPVSMDGYAHGQRWGGLVFPTATQVPRRAVARRNNPPMMFNQGGWRMTPGPSPDRAWTPFAAFGTLSQQGPPLYANPYGLYKHMNNPLPTPARICPPCVDGWAAYSKEKGCFCIPFGGAMVSRQGVRTQSQVGRRKRKRKRTRTMRQRLRNIIGL